MATQLRVRDVQRAVESVAQIRTKADTGLDTLKGAVLNIQPIELVKGWHKTSPDVTRSGRLWMKWGEATLVKFLTTGNNPSGKPADAPMPTYKMSQDDAEAIVDYLKTLK